MTLMCSMFKGPFLASRFLNIAGNLAVSVAGKLNKSSVGVLFSTFAPIMPRVIPSIKIGVGSFAFCVTGTLFFVIFSRYPVPVKHF